ncbi:arginine--tRNA ligase [Candidatus Woesearchaeota archaeon]|nr:arginine--tRNA ligase [Candidatus Woesearchaeota archaeon]
MDVFRQNVQEMLKGHGIDAALIEVPPNPTMGDFAVPCFTLAKKHKKSPQQIAADIAAILKPNAYIIRVEANGPYLNFFVNTTKRAVRVLSDIFSQKKSYGLLKAKGKKILIEFPSPNTNKPLHLGHVRNILLGQSISRLLEAMGNTVTKVNLNNDRGVHICKSMLAYKLFGNNQKPTTKTDHFVGDYYVLFNQKLAEKPELEEEAQKMLTQWEQGDAEVVAIWKQMNQWALGDFEQTYKKFGLKFDREYFESDIYTKGKEMVMACLEKGIMYKDETGAVFIDLTPWNLGKKCLMRADGTSIYITQDLYLAKLKHDEFRFDRSIYVVASEQDHHFKVLFKVLELMDYPWASNLYHLSYGMVYLPEGKMKSREGTVVDADDLVEQMQALAQTELDKRYPELAQKEKAERARKIGMAALRFFILKYDATKDFVYHPEESISFEGETGPYLQYTVARINSILKKYGKAAEEMVDISRFNADEHFLIKRLDSFPQIIEEAADQLKPHILTRYLLDLGLAFNEYYHKHQVLQEDKELEKARVLLVAMVKQVLENGLYFLGIDVLKEM